MSRSLLTEKQIRILVKNILLSEAKFIDFEAGEDDDSSRRDSSNNSKQNVSSVGSDAAERAENEFKRWGGRDENDPEMKDTLSAYWKNAKAPDYGTSQPWSAAFISYAVSPPEAPDPEFKNAAAHQKYMVAAKKARDEGKNTGFVAFKPEELEGGPDRGDIVCKPRGGGDYDGWNNIGSKNHCDIYVGNNQVIGGNLGNTSKKKSYNPEKVSMVIKKLSETYLVSEESIRSNIRKILLKEAEFIDFDAGEENTGSSSSSSSGPVHVKDPVTIQGGNYPEENVRHVEAAMTEKGITNKYLRVGILCTIAKESNFKPKSEKTYHSTGNSRIYQIWPKLKKLGDAKVEAMKKSTSPSDGHKKAGLGFFDYLYGGRYGNGPEKTGDGSRYRGRGFNQVTFKGTYKKYADLTGIDLVGNPDLLNKPDVAAKVAVAFLANRIKKGHGTVNPDVKSYEEGIKIAAEANCKSPGAKKNCSRAIRSATERLPHFKYGDDGGENLAKNDKNKDDDSKNV